MREKIVNLFLIESGGGLTLIYYEFILTLKNGYG